MTAPEDDLAEALRQALSAAAEQVEPGTEGLDRIRAKTSGRTPHPLPLSVVMDAVHWARLWAWRGHWAWQDPSYWAWATRPENFRPQTWRRWAAQVPRAIRPTQLGWARLVGGLAAAASLTAIAVAVPPLRSALVQVSSTVLTGGDENLQPAGNAGGGGSGGGTTNSLSGTQSPGSTPRGYPGGIPPQAL